MSYTTDRVLSDLESELKSTRDTWSPEQWQVAAERLGGMYDFVVDELLYRQPQKQRGRGRPKKILNALAPVISKRRSGAPREYSDAFLRTLISDVERSRELARESPSARVTDKAAIETMLMAWAKEDGASQHRYRRLVSYYQKFYSRAKSRIAKL